MGKTVFGGIACMQVMAADAGRRGNLWAGLRRHHATSFWHTETHPRVPPVERVTERPRPTTVVCTCPRCGSSQTFTPSISYLPRRCTPPSRLPAAFLPFLVFPPPTISPTMSLNRRSILLPCSVPVSRLFRHTMPVKFYRLNCWG